MANEIKDLALRIRLEMPYEEAMARVTAALKKEDFGVLTEIDVIVQTHKTV